MSMIGSQTRLKRFLLGVTLGSGLLFSVGAHATSYTFDFSFSPVSDTTMFGSGSLTADYEGGGIYQIIGITGSVDNAPTGPTPQTIEGLSSYAAADNTLSYPATPYLTFGGLSFSTAYDDYNLYWNGVYGILQASNNPVGYPNSETIDFNVTPTPLPPGILLMAGGTGLLGFFAARKRRKEGRLETAGVVR
jgi:hypothetical protein